MEDTVEKIRTKVFAREQATGNWQLASMCHSLSNHLQVCNW